jgi:hypothetical protein
MQRSRSSGSLKSGWLTWAGLSHALREIHWPRANALASGLRWLQRRLEPGSAPQPRRTRNPQKAVTCEIRHEHDGWQDEPSAKAPEAGALQGASPASRAPRAHESGPNLAKHRRGAFLPSPLPRNSRLRKTLFSQPVPGIMRPFICKLHL